MAEETIVITGVGAVTPLGPDLASSWEGLLAGRVGLRCGSPHIDPALARFPVGFAPIEEAAAREGLKPAEGRKLDPITHAALAAASQALRDAGLEEALGGDRPSWKDPTGVVLGLGYGASRTHLKSVGRISSGRVERLSPFTLTASMPNAPAANIAMRFGLRGPAFTVSTACASGVDALGTSLGLLRGGGIERVVTGGVDMLCDDLGVGGMAAARALAPVGEDSDPLVLRPFDRSRQGTAVGSGVGVFVLERERTAKARGAGILAILSGYGATCDAHHISAPLPEGEGAEAAMRKALLDAELAPEELGAVFAHGTGTPLGDRQEGLALARIFGGSVPPVTSTKGQTGHAMGASGALNLAFALRALAEGILPATVGCSDPDPDCRIVPVLGEARRGALPSCMVNAFGFGGHNASIVVRAPEPSHLSA